METTKICFKCGRELPLSQFYRMAKMADGHLNKCKDCTKKDVKERYDRLSQDPAYMEKERARGRDKYARLGYVNKEPTETQKAKRALYRGLRSTKRAVGMDKGRAEELHHWNYNINMSVIIMPRRLHHRLHAVIELNVEEGIYYYQGHPLDTLDKHLAVVKMVCEKQGYDFSKILAVA